MTRYPGECRDRWPDGRQLSTTNNPDPGFLWDDV